jgi:hypothetical protein
LPEAPVTVGQPLAPVALVSLSRLLFLSLRPGAYPTFKYRERKRTVSEKLVVKRADIELG